MSPVKPIEALRSWVRRHPARVAIQLTTALAVGWLAVFHAVLLGRRVADQSLLDPLVLFKWLLTAALIVTVGLLRRAGMRLAEPRRAAALAILVLLLHVAMPTAPPIGGVEDGEAALDWALIAIAPAALGLAAVGVLHLLTRLSRQIRPAAPAWGPPRAECGASSRRWRTLQLFGRPPPLPTSI